MKDYMTPADFMREAFNEAFTGIRNNEGGPFGAVVVLNGEIIGRGRNRVTSVNDPTAHAEINAIREACNNLEVFHLPEAVIYATCEPCPMCMAAIYWADIKTVYYCLDSGDAARIGFNDRHIYDELSKPLAKREINMEKLILPEGDGLFVEWENKADKIEY